jgi:kynurenine formamidase
MITPGMKTYPGLPEPQAEVLWDYEESRERYNHEAEFFIASLHLCGNTGTYVDAPLHRFRGGRDLAGLSLDSVAHIPVVVIDASKCPQRGIGPEYFHGHHISGRAVLIYTGWSNHWGTEDYFKPNPYLTKAAAEHLAKAGCTFAGIDSLNIDDIEDPSRPAHSILLGHDIPICEHMTNLEAVRPGGHLHAVPIAWRGGATFPVRAYVLYI